MRHRLHLAVVGWVLLVAGVLLSYAAYFTAPAPFSAYQASGSSLFWLGAFLLLGSLFLGRALGLAARYARTPKGAIVGGAYITIHLLLYGFVLEGILVSLYKIEPFVNSSLVFLSTDVLYPASLPNALLGVGFSPSLNLTVPPVFELSLSVFSLFIAVVIDILILANLEGVRRIGFGSWARSRAYIFMPVTGIVLGASCCMSLPLLLSIVNPSLAEGPGILWAFYAAYFLLPPLAIVVLKLNLDLATKVAARVPREGSAGASGP